MSVPRPVGNTSPVKLFVQTPHGPRVAAIVEGRVLRRSGRGLWTRLGEPEGWAFRQDLLERAQQLGVEQVEVIDREHSRCYRASLSALLSAPTVEVEGWGKQRVLALDAWEVIGTDSPSPPEGTPDQMTLALEGVAP